MMSSYLYNILLYQDYETSAMDTRFLPQKGLFPTSDQLCLMSKQKRNPDNGSHLLMRLSDQKNFLSDCLHFLPFPQEEAASSGNLESVSKLENVPNTNKE